MKDAWFYRNGPFSLLNDRLERELPVVLPEFRWRTVDVERDIVRKNPALHLRALAEAGMRYGGRILQHRLPPRDFFPRLPCVIRAVRDHAKTQVAPEQTALVFQTQSLFDARRDRVPHFLYTDHTYLANLRYPNPRPLLPVSRAWRAMELGLYQNATRIFTTSGFAAESVVEDYGVAADRVLAVFSGCNIIPVETPVPRNGRRILFAAVDWERKGGPELIAAFRAVRQTVPDAELHVLGCNPGVEMPGLTWQPRVSAVDAAPIFASADIFCMPSRMDPSASVLAEAAGFGLPVVATPVGGNRERVIDGETGFLCEPDALADRLVRLLRDDALRERMGCAARKFAAENFSWSAVLEKMASSIRMETAC